MAKKGKKDIVRNETELLSESDFTADNELEGEASEETWFEWDIEAYTVARNPNNNTFDLLKVQINSETNLAVVERETTRYDSVSRALMDIKVRMEQELTKRGK